MSTSSNNEWADDVSFAFVSLTPRGEKEEGVIEQVKFVPLSMLPQASELFELDLSITFGDANRSLFSKKAMIKEIDRHSYDLGRLKAAIESLPDDVYIDMEN